MKFSQKRSDWQAVVNAFDRHLPRIMADVRWRMDAKYGNIDDVLNGIFNRGVL